MSRTMKRKHVMKEMFNDNYDIPKDNQQIVRIVSSRGNNLHEVEPASINGEKFLVSMPNKFRNNVWVKRGDYLIVDPIEEGDKVKAEISRILTPEHIKEFIKQGVWPKKFTKKRELNEDESNDTNINRRPRQMNNESEKDDESSDEPDNDD